ncbi:MAG: TIGR00730 family Rossman fold protein [Rhizobiaceae bacterium]
MINSLCVYCGSSPGADPRFVEEAEKLGNSIAAHGIRLVYGGGDRGLMGTVARATLKGGGAVTGIIPEFLRDMEQANGTLGMDEAEMIVVPDMHTRKQMMFDKADAFVALPGGIGTLEELVEIQTWAQLGRHTKPIALLNVNNFWSPYVELVEHMNSAGFLHNPDRVMPLVFTDASEIIPTLLNPA